MGPTHTGCCCGRRQTLNNTLTGVKKDSADILAHLERDMLEKRTAVTTLGEKVNALSTELEATNIRIAELEKVPSPLLSPIFSQGERADLVDSHGEVVTPLPQTAHIIR